jgi:hypothetical protein
MNDEIKVSAGYVRDVALGAIQGWATGYTDPDDSGVQWYVSEVQEGVYRVNPSDMKYGPGQLFEIDVTVREVNGPMDLNREADRENRIKALEHDVETLTKQVRTLEEMRATVVRLAEWRESHDPDTLGI